jgi:hypothetical protein
LGESVRESNTLVSSLGTVMAILEIGIAIGRKQATRELLNDIGKTK